MGLAPPTVIAEYTQKRPGLTVPGTLDGIDTHELEIFLWGKITEGDRDSNHIFNFIFISSRHFAVLF